MKRLLILSGYLSFLFFASCGKMPMEKDSANNRINSRFTDSLLFGSLDNGAAVGLQSNSRGTDPTSLFGSSYSNYFGSNSSMYAPGGSSSYDPYTGSSSNPYSGSGFGNYNQNPYSPISLPYKPAIINGFDPFNVAQRYQTDPAMGAFLGLAGWVHTLAPNIQSVIKVNLSKVVGASNSIYSPATSPSPSPSPSPTSGLSCPAPYTYSSMYGCILSSLPSSCPLYVYYAPAGSCPSGTVYSSTAKGCIPACATTPTNQQGQYCANWNLKITSNKALKHLRRSLFNGDYGTVSRVDANSFNITWQSASKPTSGFIFVIQDALGAQPGALSLNITGTVQDCGSTSAPVNINLDSLVNAGTSYAPYLQQNISGSNDEIRVRAANFPSEYQQGSWFTY
jgi:hypothetical protein